jgi:hypothetical protein
VWPEVRDYTGGSDFDDRWLLSVYELGSKTKRKYGLKTLMSGWLFRQPDGPGDGVHVDVIFHGYRSTPKGDIESPRDLFADIPKGKKADEMFTEIYDRIHMVRDLVDKIESLEKIVDKEKKPGPWMDHSSPVDTSKHYRPLKSLGKFKLKKSDIKTTKLTKEFGEPKLGGIFSSVRSGISVGPCTNLNCVILCAFFDGFANYASKLYLARMLKYGLLEVCIDQEMGKANEEEIALLTETYYMGLNSVKHVEMAHIFGKSKEHKVRFSSSMGINIPKFVNSYFHKDFEWPEMNNYGEKGPIPDLMKSRIIALASDPSMTATVGPNTYFNDLGKIEVAKTFGLHVYKGDLSEFYEEIHESFYSARVAGRAISLTYQLRWFEEFVGGRNAKEVQQQMAMACGSDQKMLLLSMEVRDIASKKYFSLDEKAEAVIDWIKERAKGKYREFFYMLVLTDLFQIKEIRGVLHSNLVSGKKYDGWIKRALRSRQTLHVLHEASNQRVHPTEIKGCTNEAIQFHEKGVLHMGAEDAGYDVDISKLSALRSLSYIPKGRVTEYVGSTKVRDNSFVVGGKTFIEWYVSSFNDIVNNFKGGN